MADGDGLNALIRRRAGELGFSLVGFTPADPVEGARLHARWVALGYAGEMGYLGRNHDKRADPRLLVPGARSVVCLGMEYFQPTPPAGPLSGRIAAYARGDDYHDILKKRLFELWDDIAAAVGRPNGRAPNGRALNGRVYVDTAPVAERELAQRAGLGWRGKNTLLINKRRGSFFFLAEIVLDVELDYDEPAVDHCGTCSRCLDACPTQAFPQPYVLDARRCISYLNIELKGPIPVESRSLMGDWILGCDVCQDVCPWNRRAAQAPEPAFAPRPGLERPALAELMAMDREAFNRAFRRNPAKRPKRRGILRNAAVALGNSGDPAAVPVLVRALADEEPLVRGHAAWGLGQLGGDAAGRALGEALAGEADAYVRGEIEAALAALGVA